MNSILLDSIQQTKSRYLELENELKMKTNSIEEYVKRIIYLKSDIFKNAYDTLVKNVEVSTNIFELFNEFQSLIPSQTVK